MKVIIDGLAVNYRDDGNGRAILLLHGWGDNSMGFKGLIMELAKEYRILTPDLPGFGASELPESAWNLDRYASFCQEFLKKVGVEKIVAVIGHSNGGAIAIRALSNGRLLADKLILLASAGVRGENKRRGLAVKVATKTLKPFTLILPKKTQANLREKLYQAVHSDMLVARDMQETFKNIVSDDIQLDASKLNLPTLLIYGQDDDQTPVRHGQLISKLITDSRLVVVPSSGHFVHIDQSDTTYKLIEGFLK